MGNEIVRNQTPEEQELEKKKAEVAALEAELIQRELDLVSLRAELAEFESLYLRTVGVLYAELDEIDAQIAESEARRRPRDPQSQRRATRARAQAEESRESARGRSEPQPNCTETTKRLFREVAKKIHPDLAASDLDRARRQKFMADANVAYENGDENKLRSILADWETSPETVEGEGIGAEIVRVIRKIAQVTKRLNEIDLEMLGLQESEIHRLREKVNDGKREGRDLLSEMTSQIRNDIVVAKERLANVVESSAEK